MAPTLRILIQDGSVEVQVDSHEQDSQAYVGELEGTCIVDTKVCIRCEYEKSDRLQTVLAMYEQEINQNLSKQSKDQYHEQP